MHNQLKLSSKIKLIVSDFDGIFTDNSIYIFDDGKTAKRINYKDIMGVSVAIKNGIQVAILSGSQGEAINYLSEKFELAGAYQGIRNKLPILKELMEKLELKQDEVLYMGDDINDLECLNHAGYCVSVKEANKQVFKTERIQITEALPGNGAFREVVDTIVELKNNERESN